MNTIELAAALQLASPALPIGAFSYSQAMESAIDAGIVHDASTAQNWIAAGMDILARGEAVLLLRQCEAWRDADDDALACTNRLLMALRESAELRLESEQMGSSLARLAFELEWGDAQARERLAALRPVMLPTAYAYAAHALRIPAEHALTSWLYAWLENQVCAALKAVPLGQVAGQRILHRLRQDLTRSVDHALAARDHDISTFAPMLGVLSARHETQYSRLFRS